MSERVTEREVRLLQVARGLAVATVVVVCLRLAWVSDDALITLRTALNITHGWGPGFNGTEAVQGYTHPLWFLVWTMVGSTSDQWVLGILLVSLALTGLAVGLVAWSTRSMARLIAVTALLTLSNAFVEYATSGLETPLAYATIATLMAITLWSPPRWAVPPELTAALAGLTAAAVVLTRLDLVLVIAPAVVWATVTQRRRARLLAVAAGAGLIPLVVWFTWSQVTYRSLLSNTFEAKLNVDVPAIELGVQGLRYLWVSFENDPISLVAIVLGVVLACAGRDGMLRMWSLGVVVYLIYVVYIGGDFMAGRFLAVPVLVSCLLLARTHGDAKLSDSRDVDSSRDVVVAVVFALLLVVGSSAAGRTPVALSNPVQPRWEVDTNLNAGVSDERGTYVALGRSLKGYLDHLSMEFVNPVFRTQGNRDGLNRELREIDREAREWPTAVTLPFTPIDVGAWCGFLGTVGMATGPQVHLIDSCALTDRYLASKPYRARAPFAWKPGHFERVVPEGYAEAISAADPSLLRDPAEAFLLRQTWEETRPGTYVE